MNLSIKNMQINLLVLASPFLLAACNPSTTAKIQVTGQATMKVVPDMVELSLKAYNVRPAMKDAVIETQFAISQIMIVCHKYIRDEEDIKVSNVATNKNYEYSGNREVFKGYSAQQILEVRLKDIKQLEKFTEELLATKISTIENIRYNHSKADSIQRVVNLLALTDAKKTAEKMCEKMNVNLGKTIYLSNYPPGGGELGERRQGNTEFDINLYSKSFGGRGFKMTSEILEFQDVAFAGFEITQ
jgi:uncharacterized protein YggE